MEQGDTQFCPSCGASVTANPRYPAYFCRGCVERAVASDGRRISFSNLDASDALSDMTVAGRYVDNGEVYPSDYCEIGSVKCRAREARFGGVVVQPATVWLKTGQH
jgi:hypothetical protein